MLRSRRGGLPGRARAGKGGAYLTPVNVMNWRTLSFCARLSEFIAAWRGLLRAAWSPQESAGAPRGRRTLEYRE